MKAIGLGREKLVTREGVNAWRRKFLRGWAAEPETGQEKNHLRKTEGSSMGEGG